MSSRSVRSITAAQGCIFSTGNFLLIKPFVFYLSFAAQQKVFVMPNMDDIYLPLMTSGLANPPTSRNSSVHSSSHQSSMESQEYLSE